jgi:hypothetical protein
MPINIDQIKNSVDIVTVIDGYIGLKKAGKDYQACCPFHAENTPSFTVVQNKQFYHCFGCGAHGDVIGFLEEFLNIDFVDAVKIIDSNAFDGQHNSDYVKTVRIHLPLNQVKQETASDVLNDCTEFNGHYFAGACQVLPLINVTGELLSLAMVTGEGFDIKFLNKKFVFGSCAIFGELKELAVLTVNYWQAMRLNRDYGLCTICVFDPLNFYFIVNDLRRLGVESRLICNELECFIQAEKLRVYEVFNKQFGVNVGVEGYLGE